MKIGTPEEDDMGGFAPLPLDVRFWRHVEKGDEHQCWPWRSSVNKGGYGVFVYGSKHDRHSMSAHRMAYTLTYGGVEAGAVVMHACDNPRCCNPAHLLVGTHGDNAADCVLKERRAKKHAFAPRVRKLSDDDVRKVRELAEVYVAVYGGVEAWRIAGDVGCSESHVYGILGGRRKAHVK